jgi:hypothetical protein
MQEKNSGLQDCPETAEGCDGRSNNFRLCKLDSVILVNWNLRDEEGRMPPRALNPESLPKGPSLFRIRRSFIGSFSRPKLSEFGF